MRRQPEFADSGRKSRSRGGRDSGGADRCGESYQCGGDVRSLDVELGNAKALTVLGNGPIVINGAALGGPWQPLNVIGT